jgi:hypothetical protein
MKNLIQIETKNNVKNMMRRILNKVKESNLKIDLKNKLSGAF